MGLPLRNPDLLYVRTPLDAQPHTSNRTQTILDQLQRREDSAPDNLEFERLGERFEQFIGSPPSSSASHHLRATRRTHPNPITAAASAALSRNRVSKYSPLSRSDAVRDKPSQDEILEYRNRMDISLGDSANVERLLRIENLDEVTTSGKGVD